MKKISIFLGLSLSLFSACDSGEDDSNREAVYYNISETPKTTLSEILKAREYTRNKLLIASDIPLFEENGYGVLDKQTGESHILMKNMVGESYEKPADSSRKSVLMFSQITDIHFTDVESPIRSVYGLAISPSAYRPHSIYAAHITDAMIQTLSYFHTKAKQDFLLVTGDTIDNGEQIEQDWFNSVLNGGEVRIDSGEISDPVKGSGNDFTDPFISKGVPYDLPWFGSIGNHDIMFSGIFYIDDETSKAFQGEDIPTISIGTPVYTGTQDGTTEYAEPYCAFKKIIKNDKAAAMFVEVGDTEFCPEPKTPADSRRKPFQTHAEFLNYVADTKGYQIVNENSEKAYYSIRPLPQLPIEIITLDTSASRVNFLVDGNLNKGKQNEAGFIDRVQFDWLANRLQELENNNVAVFIVQHHPSYDLDDNSEISKAEYRELLKKHHNVLALIVGHGHKNRVDYYEPITEEEHGFFEIQTSGLLDFPEQARMFELVSNGDGTLSLISTMIDHASTENSLSDLGRKLSLSQLQVGGQSNIDSSIGVLEDRNVDLVIKVPQQIYSNIISVDRNITGLRTYKLDK
ncbi:metallophosphoesterase [bacterium]|nr:metallophosphoesterase [bacterium]